MRVPTDDLEIIASVLQGDIDRFGEIVQRYQSRVFAIARNHVPPSAIEDVSQETFLAAFRSLHSFRGESPFENWISKLAIRRCYDYWRKRKRREEVSITRLERKHANLLEKLFDGEAHNTFSAEEAKREAREILEFALSHLSSEERMVITLSYLEDRSLSETATLLGWSLANVKVRSFRAKKKLRKVIEQLFLKEQHEE